MNLRKKIVITGGLGHIGSGLFKEINKYFPNFTIYLIDDLSSNNFQSLYNLSKKIKLYFFNKNIIDINSISLLQKIKKIDYVIHLAAQTNATNSFKHPRKLYQNNYQGTKQVVNFCIKKKSKLIFISSTSIYGTNSNLLDENTSNLNPETPYALCKLKEENFIKKNSRNIKFTIFRFGTIFGVTPGIRFHTAVNKFCYQASISESLTIWKNAYNQKRPYLDVEDGIRAIIFIINNNVFKNEIYNILTNNYKVSTIVKYIKNFKKIRIKYVDSYILNQTSYNVSNLKFKNLGFNYKGDIKKQIKNTLNLLNNIK